MVGYQHQLAEITQKIADIRKRLGMRGGTTVVTSTMTNGAKPKRHLSAKAIKAIREAQKKRWAAFHAKQGKPAKKAATKKRTLSPEAKAKLAANLAKARAARAAKKAAA
jgi:hypothetical protein